MRAGGRAISIMASDVRNGPMDTTMKVADGFIIRELREGVEIG